MEKQFITRTEASKRLGVNRQTISNYIKAGFFKTIKTSSKTNGQTLVDLESFEKFINSLYKDSDINDLEKRIESYKTELLKTQNDLEEQISENKRKIRSIRDSNTLRYYLIRSEKFWYTINNLLKHIQKNQKIYLNTTDTEFKTIDYVVLEEIIQGKSFGEISKDTGETERSISSRFYRIAKKISQIELIDKSSEKDDEIERLRDIIKTLSRKLSKKNQKEFLESYPEDLQIVLNKTVFEYLDELGANRRAINSLKYYFKDDDKVLKLFGTTCNRLLHIRNLGKKTVYDLIDSIENNLGNIPELKQFELFKEGAH